MTNDDILTDVANMRFVTQDDNCNVCGHKRNRRCSCGEQIVEECWHPKVRKNRGDDGPPEVDGTQVCDWFECDQLLEPKEADNARSLR